MWSGRDQHGGHDDERHCGSSICSASGVKDHRDAPRDHQKQHECEQCKTACRSERCCEANESVGGNAEQEKECHQKEWCGREEGGTSSPLEELAEPGDQRRGECVAKVWC
jgi:hypothetical protein